MCRSSDSGRSLQKRSIDYYQRGNDACQAKKTKVTAIPNSLYDQSDMSKCNVCHSFELTYLNHASRNLPLALKGSKCPSASGAIPPANLEVYEPRTTWSRKDCSAYWNRLHACQCNGTVGNGCDRSQVHRRFNGPVCYRLPIGGLQDSVRGKYASYGDTQCSETHACARLENTRLPLFRWLPP